MQIFGSGDYAMRIWLNPEKIAERGMTADDVIAAVRQQNVQVAAGVINGPPYGQTGELQLPINVEGPPQRRPSNSANIVVKRDQRRRSRGWGTWRASRSTPSQYGLRSLLDNKQAVAHPDLPVARLQRHRRFPIRSAPPWRS